MQMPRHEFLAPEEQEYKDCIHCHIRRSLACTMCGYCYECHHVIEEIEYKPTKVSYDLSKLEDVEPA